LRASEDILNQLQSPLTPEKFLPCFEAQAVAISDQIASLNSDIEDLIHLLQGTEELRNKAFGLLDRAPIAGLDAMDVREIIDKCVQSPEALGGYKSGWGRRDRLNLTLRAIIANSKSRVLKCKSFEDSLEYPIAPPVDMAVALDLLERASRSIIYTNHEIRLRDTIAEAAMTLMFQTFLTLEYEKVKPSAKHPTDVLAEKMRADFEHWRQDYIKEVIRETPEQFAISEPMMRDAVSGDHDLWELVNPAVRVVDYISEMTDRFVVHDVFKGHVLQAVLHDQFDRGFLNEQ